MKAALVAVVACLVTVANAECPNSCSGHGACGVNDQCICQQGFRANDCSERTCPYGNAWMTTPRGDLNYDGNLHSASIYDANNLFTSRSHVVTAENAGGTWEYWPGFAQSGEGHFQMECSNAGICNKELGECDCFEGFEGYNCGRMSCPGGNDCNGHGRCMTISQQVAEHNSNTGNSLSYTLWDADMARSCVCDPGYTGLGCADRVCPRGDDPLTKAHQVDEIQWIDIKSSVVTDATTGGALGGTFTITYESLDGEKYTTDPIAFEEYRGATSGATLKTAVENALTALPNGLIPSVTVTPGYCETTLAKGFTSDFAAAGGNNVGTQPANGKFMRCPALTSCANLIYLIDTTNSVYSNGEGSCGATIGAATTPVFAPLEVQGCTVMDTPRCTRFAIRFTDPMTSGDLKKLSVNIDSITLAGLTNAASNNAAGISYVVHETLPLNDASETMAQSFKYAPSITIEDQSAGGVSGATITFSAGINSGAPAILPKDAKIRLYCGNAGAAYVDMGTYTVSATETVQDSGTLVLSQAINDPQSLCSDAGSDHIKIQLLTNYLETTVDYSSTDIASGYYGFTLDGTAIKSTATGSSYDATDGVGYVLLTEQPAGLTADIANGDKDLVIAGAGTKESDFCSGRGTCDYETGLCQCFKGYTGEACQNQNALWVGSE